MSKVYGSEKIRRTCAIRGREQEGRFGLLRQNVHTSKILPSNGEGAEQEIDTALVYDVRIQPRPPVKTNKSAGEPKTHPADKPERRLVLIEGRGDTRFHLLRKAGDDAKVLEVGVAGQGDWIQTSQIREEFLVPPTVTRVRYVERKPFTLCKLAETGDQDYLLLRTTSKGARIIPVYENNYGQTVDPATLVDVRTINAKKKRKKKGSNGEATEGQEALAPVEAEAQSAPVAPAPVAHAPVAHAPQAPAPAAHAPQAHPAQQHAPAAHAPQPAVQPQQRPAQQPGRPVPQQVQPGQARPAPVGVAPRPAQPGRPPGR